MSEAIGSAFPQTTRQTCIVHRIRISLDYASWKDRNAVAAAIKPICTAASEAAANVLDDFAAGPWNGKYAPSATCGAAPGST